MRLNYLNQKREDTIPPLLDLLARRPELRDVGIAGYLAGAAVAGAPGMPNTYSFDGLGAVIVHRPDLQVWAHLFSEVAA